MNLTAGWYPVLLRNALDRFMTLRVTSIRRPRRRQISTPAFPLSNSHCSDRDTLGTQNLANRRQATLNDGKFGTTLPQVSGTVHD